MKSEPDRVLHSMRAFDGTSPEDYHAAMWETTHHGLAHVDQDGKFLDANEAFCRIVGRTWPQLLEITLYDISPHQDLNVDAAQAAAVITGAMRSYGMDRSYALPNNTLVPVHMQVRRIPYSRAHDFEHFHVAIYQKAPIKNLVHETDKSGVLSSRTSTYWRDFVKDNPAFVFWSIIILLFFTFLSGNATALFTLLDNHLP